jgi:hypothetical protein
MLNSYTLYGDAGGGRDHGFIVVSGYLSTFGRWCSFVAAWQYTLACFNAPYFHMKEFSQSKGPFASWKGEEPRRARFLGALAEIIHANVELSLACIVEFKTFEKVNQRYALAEAVGVPYSYAARGCVSHSHQYLRKKNIGVLPEINYVFEDGDEGRGELTRVLLKDGYNAPIFRPSRDRTAKDGTPVRGFVQLQAADFAAYEIRKAFRDNPEEDWPLEKYRKSIRALGKINSWWGKFTEHDILYMCRKAQLRLRKATG